MSSGPTRVRKYRVRFVDILGVAAKTFVEGHFIVDVSRDRAVAIHEGSVTETAPIRRTMAVMAKINVCIAVAVSAKSAITPITAG